MRILFLPTILFSHFAFAGTLDVMNQRLTVHKESRPIECFDPKFQNSSYGLKFALACSYKCLNAQSKTGHFNEVFSPEAQGLSPGNGSAGDKIIWSSLTVGLKTWSEKVCLDQAAEACGNISSVEEVALDSIESGKWKIQKFPSCKETSVTLSPFDNDSGAEKFYNITGNLIKKSAPETTADDFSFQAKGITLHLPINDDEDKKCDRKILGSICYGDCIDMNAKGKELVETLATPEPLGTDEVTVCADELYSRFKELKISKQTKKMICENYFWTTIMKGKISVKTCAAVRGDVNCDAVIE